MNFLSVGRLVYPLCLAWQRVNLAVKLPILSLPSGVFGGGGGMVPPLDSHSPHFLTVTLSSSPQKRYSIMILHCYEDAENLFPDFHLKKPCS